MSVHKSRTNFFMTEEGLAIKDELTKMAAETVFKTESSYSANTELYPDNVIPFVNKHMEYLRTHPAVDPDQYMANLRVMTRIR